jgi:hypothetical protein
MKYKIFSGRRLSLKLTEAMQFELRMASQKMGVTVSEIIRRAVDSALKKIK